MLPGHKNENRLPGGRGQIPDQAAIAEQSASANRRAVAQLSANELASDDSTEFPVERQSTDAISNLPKELQQKDELISALIHELEQAVEKLDRYERNGTERTQPASTPSSASRNFSNSSAPFMDSLQRMVEDWEQSQPHSQLERIESQLAAVHDLVQNLQRPDHARSDFTRVEEPSRSLLSYQAETSEEDVCGVTLDEKSSTWDAIRNQLLESEPDAPAEIFAVSQEDSDLLRLLSETPAPASVDFHLATTEVFKKAIEERDAYIIQLNRLIRMKNYFKVPTDWAALANVPTQMQLRIESLIEHLDVQVRLGEVEMSLERARLARERSQIQSEREHLEKHLRRLGLSSIADLDNISASTSSTGDRRWMRFIGGNSK